MIAKSTASGTTRRAGRAWTYPLCATALVGSMSAAMSSAAAASPTGPPNLTYKGTITMYASTYNPPLPGVTVPPGTVADKEMLTAAAAFEKMYPGITIKFLPASAEIGTGQWYISEAAAGTLPDVSMVPGYYVNITLPNGLYQNLIPAFEKPNPFIPGNTKWISTMDPYALRIDTVPGNTPGTTGIFVVNGDSSGIGFYYNKNLFREAGITAPPTTWLQLEADSKQIDSRLSSKGVYAGASFAPVIYNWFAHLFQTNYLGLAWQRTVANLPVTLASAWPSYFYYHDGDFLNPVKKPGDDRLVCRRESGHKYLGPQGHRRAGKHGVNDTHRCTDVPWPTGGVRIHPGVFDPTPDRRPAKITAVPGGVFRDPKLQRDLALCDQSPDMAGQRRPGRSLPIRDCVAEIR